LLVASVAAAHAGEDKQGFVQAAAVAAAVGVVAAGGAAADLVGVPELYHLQSWWAISKPWRKASCTCLPKGLLTKLLGLQLMAYYAKTACTYYWISYNMLFHGVVYQFMLYRWAILSASTESSQQANSLFSLCAIVHDNVRKRPQLQHVSKQAHYLACVQ